MSLFQPGYRSPQSPPMVTGVRPGSRMRAAETAYAASAGAGRVAGQLDCGFRSRSPTCSRSASMKPLTIASAGKPHFDAYLDAARTSSASWGAAPSPCWPSSRNGHRSPWLGWRRPGTPASASDGCHPRACRNRPTARPSHPSCKPSPPVARRLQSAEQIEVYVEIALNLMARTTGSIHGHHTTFPSPGLPHFFEQAPSPARPPVSPPA
jgi:hypothetical protein